ncbi:MAG TPA: isoleucine--tRNA ligase, partial [Elusimicrobia bacterium]|nr:isoleucine--tRNA ligase [Elusimicrobiota bacterium]
CMHCKTALAQAEVEYEGQTTPSVYVKFPVKAPSPALAQALGGRTASLAIWTTTPWTLPANLALAIHPGETYTALEVGGEWLITARRSALYVGFIDGVRGRAAATGLAVSGEALAGTLARHPWLERDVPVIPADFVAMDTGTGLVHIAPGHGEEDYELGRKAGLKVYNPVDDDGRFRAEVTHFAGLTVWEANPRIIEHLRSVGALVASVPFEHTYPHCWRCKNPTLFLATEQWFIALDQTGLRQKALDAIRRDVRWIPPWGEERIFNMVAHRPEWVISRQRVWGVPIVAFYCQACDGLLLDEPLVEHVAAIMRAGRGADEWHAREAADLLPPGTVCPNCGGVSFRKETDILDVWFDSGCSHAAVLETRADLRWPADMYLEGSDQHRGWFQTSLIPSVALRGEPPFRTVLTHGMVLDEQGRAMHKSIGNNVSPQEVISKYGAEILRLWVALCDYSEDVRISEKLLSGPIDTYRKIRNTIRYLLGNLSDFNPAKHRMSDEKLLETDRYIRARLAVTAAAVDKHYRNFQFRPAIRAVADFCILDLSAFYLDSLKDRLYTLSADNPARRSGQTVLYDTLTAVLKMISPVLSFTAEESWQTARKEIAPDLEESVFLSDYPRLPAAWLDVSLLEKWERIMRVREQATKAIEELRKTGVVGSSLEAKVIFRTSKEETAAFIRGNEALWPQALIVSECALEMDPSAEELEIKVLQAEGEKCPRCWQRRKDIGFNAAHPGVCSRCAAALEEK